MNQPQRHPVIVRQLDAHTHTELFNRLRRRAVTIKPFKGAAAWGSSERQSAGGRCAECRGASVIDHPDRICRQRTRLTCHFKSRGIESLRQQLARPHILVAGVGPKCVNGVRKIGPFFPLINSVSPGPNAPNASTSQLKKFPIVSIAPVAIDSIFSSGVCARVKNARREPSDDQNTFLASSPPGTAPSSPRSSLRKNS